MNNGDVYYYKGNSYLVICPDAEFKLGDSWVPAVVYRSNKGKMFVRELEEFERLFKTTPE